MGQCYLYLLASTHAIPSAFIHLENKEAPQVTYFGESSLIRLSAELVTLCFLPSPYTVEILSTH